MRELWLEILRAITSTIMWEDQALDVLTTIHVASEDPELMSATEDMREEIADPNGEWKALRVCKEVTEYDIENLTAEDLI